MVSQLRLMIVDALYLLAANNICCNKIIYTFTSLLIVKSSTVFLILYLAISTFECIQETITINHCEIIYKKYIFVNIIQIEAIDSQLVSNSLEKDLQKIEQGIHRQSYIRVAPTALSFDNKLINKHKLTFHSREIQLSNLLALSSSFCQAKTKIWKCSQT